MIQMNKVSIGGASALYKQAVDEERGQQRRIGKQEGGEVVWIAFCDEPSILMTPFLLSMGE